MIRLTVILLTICLTACQIPPEQRETSTSYMVPSGSKLILNSDIYIPAFRLKIFVQGGRLAFSPNQYYPYCKFTVREVKPHPQLIKADEFEIFRTRRVTDLFAALSSSQMYAARYTGGSGRGGDIPTSIVFGTEMDLRSATQPDVFRFMCGHLQDPNITARHIAIVDIRETLGGLFTLQLPGDLVSLESQ